MVYPTNLEYLNENSHRSFPLKSNVTKKDSNEVFSIPDAFITDLKLSAGSDISLRFYISKLSYLDPYIVLEISDGSSVLAGTITIDVSTHVINNSYSVAPASAYSAFSGSMTIGDLAFLSNAPSGIFEFSITDSEFEPVTIVPSQKQVDRIVFRNYDGTTISASGNVGIVARSNIRFQEGATANVINFDVGDGLGLNQACNDAEPILTINGIAPDAGGNFLLEFDSCITNTPITNGLRIDDVCSSTCAGCEELEVLTNRLIDMENSLISLRDRYNTLRSAHETYQTNVEQTIFI